jgi:hypothetical protein
MSRLLFPLAALLLFVVPTSAGVSYDFSWSDDGGEVQNSTSRLSSSGDGFAATGTLELDPAIGDGDLFELADVISYNITVTNGGTPLSTFTDANQADYVISSIDTAIGGIRSGNELIFDRFAITRSDRYFGSAAVFNPVLTSVDTVYDDDGDFAGLANNTGLDQNGFYVRFDSAADNQSSYRATLSGNVVPEPASLSIFACGALGLMLRRRRSPA